MYFGFTAIASVEANPLKQPYKSEFNSYKVSSSNEGVNQFNKELKIDRSSSPNQSDKCDIFDAPRSTACLGPTKGYQAQNNFERIVQKSATYAKDLNKLIKQLKNLFIPSIEELVNK